MLSKSTPAYIGVIVFTRDSIRIHTHKRARETRLTIEMRNLSHCPSQGSENSGGIVLGQECTVHNNTHDRWLPLSANSIGFFFFAVWFSYPNCCCFQHYLSECASTSRSYDRGASGYCGAGDSCCSLICKP